MNNLEKEYEASVNEIKTDQYTLSVGELVNMYKEGDLTIFPEYQRYFRWDSQQKSSFIESLILGIPIPSIFVSQDSEGKWDVIDGLQRLSTILQFMNELKGYNSFTAESTKFLPSLKGKNWKNIDAKFQRLIKRRRINAIIIDASNNPQIKYELFQRLNTNGTQLSAQEIRNVVVLMANKNLFNKINELSENTHFTNIIKSMTSKQRSEQLHKELIVECFILVTRKSEEIVASKDLEPVLTNLLIDNQQLSDDYQVEKITEKLLKVFELMDKVLHDSASKKYDCKKNKDINRFSRPVFELTFMYTFNNYNRIIKDNKQLVKFHNNIMNMPVYKKTMSRGFRPTDRVKNILKLSEKTNE